MVTEEKDSDNFQELLLTEKAEPQSNRGKKGICVKGGQADVCNSHTRVHIKFHGVNKKCLGREWTRKGLTYFFL